MTTAVQPAATSTGSPAKVVAGTTAVLGVQFTDDTGTAYDPTTVAASCGQRGTAGATLTNGTDSAITKTGVGDYQAEFDTSSSTGGVADWDWQWTTPGATCTGSFKVTAAPYGTTPPAPSEPVIDGGGAFTSTFDDTIDGGHAVSGG